VKQAIFDKFMEKFGAARQKRRELEEKQSDYVDEALRRGVEQAGQSEHHSSTRFVTPSEYPTPRH